MYASQEQRPAEIEEVSRWPAHRLRAEVDVTAARLADGLSSLTPVDWGAQVRSARGRHQTWAIKGSEATAVTISAPAAIVIGWLVGRLAPGDLLEASYTHELPTLPAWP